MSLLSRGKVTYLRGALFGGGILYGVLALKGYAPTWFGPENSRWSKEKWSSSAQQVLEELEEDSDFRPYTISPSTRNFINTHSSTEARRIRSVYYFNRKQRLLIGLVHFGADCEGPPR